MPAVPLILCMDELHIIDGNCTPPCRRAGGIHHESSIVRQGIKVADCSPEAPRCNPGTNSANCRGDRLPSYQSSAPEQRAS